MPNLEGNIGLNAASYMRSVENMTRSLRNYATVAEQADKITREFAKGDTFFGKLGQQIGIAKQQFEDLRRAADQLRTLKIDWQSALGLEEAGDDIKAQREAVQALGLTLIEVKRAVKDLGDAWETLTPAERIIMRQKEATDLVRQSLTALKTAGTDAFTKLRENYKGYDESIRQSGGIKDQLARIKELEKALTGIDKEIAKRAKVAADPKLSTPKRQAAEMIIAAKTQERSTVVAQIADLTKEVGSQLNNVEVQIKQALSGDIDKVVKDYFGGAFKNATPEVKLQAEKLKIALREALAKSGGKLTPEDIMGKITYKNTGDPGEIKKIAAAQEKYSDVYIALKNIEIAKEKQLNVEEQKRLDLLKDIITYKLRERIILPTTAVPEDRVKMDASREQFIKKYTSDLFVPDTADPTELSKITDRDVDDFIKQLQTKQGLNKLAEQQPELARDYLIVQKQITAEEEKQKNIKIEAARARALELARQPKYIDANLQRAMKVDEVDQPGYALKAAAGVAALQEAKANAIEVRPDMSDADIEKELGLLQAQLKTKENWTELYRQSPNLIRAEQNALKLSLEEQKRATAELAKSRAKDVRTGLANTAQMKDYSFLKIDMPDFAGTGADSAAITTAQKHLRYTIDAAASQYDKIRRDTLTAASTEIGAKSDVFKNKFPENDPQAMVEGMLEGTIKPEDKQFLLTEFPRTYDAVLKLAQERLRIEQVILQDMKAQGAALTKGSKEARTNQDYKKEQENLAKLRSSGGSEKVQDYFQQTYQRKISGLGQVGVSLAGEKMYQAYAKTNLEANKFYDTILKISNGDKELIRQYNELSVAVANFGRAIKTGEQTSAQIVAHWDNFYRLILARGITWAFYNITRQMETAVRAAQDLYIAIAEIQTISRGSALSVDDWANQIRNLSDIYRIAQKDIAEAIYEITSNQIAAGQGAISFASIAGPFAKATKATMTDAVNILSSALNSMNIEVANSDILAAQLFKTVDLGRVRIADMANQFGRVTSLAGQMSVSLEEVNAMIAHLTIAGVKYERASTYIVNILNSMVKPSKAMEEFLGFIGASSGEAAVNMYGFLGVMKEAVKYTHGQSGEMSELFRNMRAMIGVGATTRDLDQLEKYIEAQKTAMKDYLAAQKFITEGPGDRLLGVTNRVKNIFIDIAQTFVSDILLGLDEGVKNINKGLTGKKGEGIADLAAFTPSLISVVMGSAGGKLAAAIPNNPVIKTAFTKLGMFSGLAFAAGFGVTAVRQIMADRKYSLEETFGDPDKRALDREKLYHDEKERIGKIRAAETASFELTNNAWEEALKERESAWKKHFDVLTKEPQRLIEASKEVGSFFEDMVKRQQDMLVGYAQDSGGEAVARMAITEDLFSRIGSYGTPDDPNKFTMDMAKRFLTQGQETLSFLDKSIQAIEMDKSEEPEYYMLFQMQREMLLSSMQQVIGQMAATSGTPIGLDPYATIYAAKTQEDFWTEYLKDFEELGKFLEETLKEGNTRLDIIANAVKFNQPAEQETMFNNIIAGNPYFKSMTDLSKQHNELLDWRAGQEKEIDKQLQGIGGGQVGQYFMPKGLFENAYAASKGLNDLGLGDTQLTEAEAIKNFWVSVNGIIPPEQVDAFQERFIKFIESFDQATIAFNEKYKDFSYFQSPQVKSVRELLAASSDSGIRERLVEMGASNVDAIDFGLAKGGAVPGRPKGSDTVPAWLTPGEFVVNQSAAQRHAGLLQSINSSQYLADGGYAYPEGYSRRMYSDNSSRRMYSDNSSRRMYSDNSSRRMYSDNSSRRMIPEYGSRRMIPEYGSRRLPERRSRYYVDGGPIGYYANGGAIREHNEMLRQRREMIRMMQEQGIRPGGSGFMASGAGSTGKHMAASGMMGSGFMYSGAGATRMPYAGMGDKAGEMNTLFHNVRESMSAGDKAGEMNTLFHNVRESMGAGNKAGEMNTLFHNVRESMGTRRLNDTKGVITGPDGKEIRYKPKEYAKHQRGSRPGYRKISGFGTTAEANPELDNIIAKNMSGINYLQPIADVLSNQKKELTPQQQYKKAYLQKELARRKEEGTALTADVNRYDLAFNRVGALSLAAPLAFMAPAALGATGAGSLLMPQTISGAVGDLGLAGAFSAYDYYQDPANFSPWSIPGNVAGSLLGGAALKVGGAGAMYGYGGLKTALGVGGKGFRGAGEMVKKGWNYPLPGSALANKNRVAQPSFVRKQIEASRLRQSEQMAEMQAFSPDMPGNMTADWAKLYQGTNLHTAPLTINQLGQDKMFGKMGAFRGYERSLREQAMNQWQFGQNSAMYGFANGGWVPNRPRTHFQSGGRVSGATTNNYSTTANVTLQSSGNESYDARRLMDQINKESHRGTRRLTNVS